MSELKPCPFCGKPGVLKQEEDHHGEFYHLGCSSIECPANHILYTMTPEEMPVVEAVIWWNTRATGGNDGE